MPAKLKTSISKPALKKTNVSGKTLEEVSKKLDKLPAWGKYDCEIKYSYKTDASGNVTEVTLTGKPVITMPIWKEWSKGDRESQKKWDIMWVKLKRHEEEHHNKTLGEIKKLEAKMKKAKSLSEKDFKKMMDQFYKDLSKAQKDYDKKSDHGKKEGVKL